MLQSFGRKVEAHLLDQDQGGASVPLMVVTLDNLANRTASRRRYILRVSALSTFDGRLCAYHGCNG